MLRELGLPRWMLIYGVAIPLALFLGYLLADPLAFRSYAFTGLLLMVLSIPLWIRWHHLVLVAGWNAAVIVFFLPGQPTLGVTLSFLSLGIAVLTRTLNKRMRFLSAPSVTLPLVLLTGVVLLTAAATGGIGGRVFGAELWGAKRYLGVIGAVVGYFALTSQRIAPERRRLAVNLYFLSAITAAVSDLIYMAGPRFYFLFQVFPSDLAVLQALTVDSLFRLSGLSFGAMAFYIFMLVHYGIRGIMDLRRPWRLAVFVAMLALSLLGGYRSLILIMFFIFLAQFWFEGLVRTKLMPVLALSAVLAGALLVGFIERMPLSVQRALSFLPIEIDPSAKHDAMSTLDWRLTMWKVVLPEVPRYLFFGKGYSYSGTDYFLTQEAVRRGLAQSYEDVLVSGNYHNGVLTILIPFGIWGLGCFLWFCWAALRLLHRNYVNSPPELKAVNTFLISYFCARLVMYVTLYGQFDLDLMHFVGIVGMSIALNARPPEQPAASVARRLDPTASVRQLVPARSGSL